MSLISIGSFGKTVKLENDSESSWRMVWDYSPTPFDVSATSIKLCSLLELAFLFEGCGIELDMMEAQMTSSISESECVQRFV